ncbi:FAD-dependent monooxygenase [Massilia cavernae]|uniref:FAD-dependent monooxygenase n=1 Tax=Massilia cavernae TaxID=2320864 RepID=UPI0016001767|nr:FAD-dependent monooxygenase [Massilia cavernae]
MVEIDPAWGSGGAAINIGSEARQSFQALGILDRYLAHTAGTAVPRPLLARILADAAIAAGADVRLGTTVKAFRQDPEGVDVEFSDARGARYDLLVGADGVHSKMREMVLRGAPRPAFSGQVHWCAVLPQPAGQQRTAAWREAGVDVELHPVSDNLMLLSVREMRPPLDPVAPRQVLARLRELLDGFPTRSVRDLAARLGNDSQPSRHALEHLDLPLPWHVGRALLIGDAVHGTTARFTPDACLGMDDAIILAQELGRAASVADALACYGERRWKASRKAAGRN